MKPEKKFLFDLDFDSPESPKQEVVDIPVEEVVEEIEEIVPTFSDEDINEAREESFAAGKAEGIREASEATERQITELLAKLVENMNELFRIQEKANDTMARNAVAVAASIAGKAFPDLSRKNDLGEVETVVGLAMEKAIRQPRVVITVSQQLYDPLSKRIDALIAEKGYEGKVELIAKAELPSGDCRVEWNDGGAERNLPAIWQEIDEIIRRNLGAGIEYMERASPDTAESGQQDQTARKRAINL